jgi:5'-methylthioadenosine phosphorylase
MFAVIGGSGFEKFDGFEKVEDLPRETPFGLTSSGFKKVRVGGKEILFISRHGECHEVLPTEINYRANIFALKKFGAKAILSFSAVGSLRAELEPEHLVIPLQYIDRTKGVRKHTFCGEGLVGHMSLAHPVCEAFARRVFELAQAAKITSHIGGTYVCIEGPNFSTLAESLTYRDIPADIIGMTNFPEYALAREAGMSYLPCSFITDYDCWDTARPHVTLEEVLKIMRRNNGKAFALLQSILNSQDDLLKGCECADQGLRTGLFVPVDKLAANLREWVEVLVR